MRLIIQLFIVHLLLNCQQTVKEQQATLVDEQKYYALPDEEMIANRISKAKERLEQSDAGQILWKSIEYHGGLKNWWSNGLLYFRFNYQPKPETCTLRDTYEMADYWSSKTRHQRVQHTTQEYGWDGEKA